MDTEDVTLPNGEVVTLRALTGYEVMLGRKINPDDQIAMNGFMLATSMGHDDPKTASAVGVEWMKRHRAGDFQHAVEEVQRLSGMGGAADKSGVAEARD
jgi:hypothetical protein